MDVTYIVVLVTVKNKKEGAKIAEALLAQKLAACVNMLDGVESHFLWKGNVDTAEESLLIIKTRRVSFKDVRKVVKDLHSYDVPEIIALPIIDGDEGYLGWVGDVTGKNHKSQNTNHKQ